MGLFDRFRKRVNEVVEETDTEAISAEENTSEAIEALGNQQSVDAIENEEDWDDIEEIEEPELQQSSEEKSTDDDWDDWEEFDDDEPIIPQQLSRKERKRQQKEKKAQIKAAKAHKKAMKKRGAVEVARPKGSKVDLSMMRTTTGRKLVEVKQAPKGSVRKAEIETETGTKIEVELGGGVVEQGGRVIKAGDGMNNLLEELEWVLLESDISSDAVTAVIDA